MVSDLSDLTWTSTNAAFQAMSKFEPSEWRHFAKGGVFSKLQRHACALLRIKESEIDVKNRWGRKGDYIVHWGGFMADLAVKAPRTGLKRLVDENGANALEFESRLWEEITYERMKADWRAREALLSTGNRVLVELNRFAEHDVKKGNLERVLWGGHVSEQDDRLYGANLMGRVLMRVRDRLMKETGESPKLQLKMANKLFKEQKRDHDATMRRKRARSASLNTANKRAACCVEAASPSAVEGACVEV
jgi:hypothetical protein